MVDCRGFTILLPVLGQFNRKRLRALGSQRRQTSFLPSSSCRYNTRRTPTVQECALAQTIEGWQRRCEEHLHGIPIFKEAVYYGDQRRYEFASVLALGSPNRPQTLFPQSCKLPACNVVIVHVIKFGFPKLGKHFGVPHNKDYGILEFRLGSPNLGKLPY